MLNFWYSPRSPNTLQIVIEGKGKLAAFCTLTVVTWGLLKNLLKHFELFHITKAKHKLVMQNELKDKIALLDCLIGLESTLAISILLLHYALWYIVCYFLCYYYMLLYWMAMKICMNKNRIQIWFVNYDWLIE